MRYLKGVLFKVGRHNGVYQSWPFSPTVESDEFIAWDFPSGALTNDVVKTQSHTRQASFDKARGEGYDKRKRTGHSRIHSLFSVDSPCSPAIKRFSTLGMCPLLTSQFDPPWSVYKTNILRYFVLPTFTKVELLEYVVSTAVITTEPRLRTRFLFPLSQIQ